MQSRVRAQTSYEVSEWVNEEAQFLLATSVLTGYKYTIKKQGECPKTCCLLNKLSNRDTEHYPWHPHLPLRDIAFVGKVRNRSNGRSLRLSAVQSCPTFSTRQKTLAGETTALHLMCLLQIMTLDRYLKAPRGVKRGKNEKKTVLVACRLKTSSVGEFVISFYLRCCKCYLNFEVPTWGWNENFYLNSLWWWAFGLAVK